MTRVLSILLALAGGCSALVDVGAPQCRADADCTALGLSGSCNQGVCTGADTIDSQLDALTVVDACGGVSCQGIEAPVCFSGQCAPRDQVAPFVCEAPEPVAQASVLFAAQIIEYTRPNQPIPGLRVAACSVTDFTCDEPLTEVHPTSSREIEIELPLGFDGFLTIESEITVPFIWHFTAPLNGPVPPRVVYVLSRDSVKLVANVAGIDVDLQSMGIVVIQAHDCQGVPRGGIHFEKQVAGGTPFYLADLLPNLEAAETIYDRNRDIAVGGFFNVPQGFTLLTARLGVDGPIIASRNAFVQPDTVTYLDVRR